MWVLVHTEDSYLMLWLKLNHMSPESSVCSGSHHSEKNLQFDWVANWLLLGSPWVPACKMFHINDSPNLTHCNNYQPFFVGRVLFPGLHDEDFVMLSNETADGMVDHAVNSMSLLHPLILPRLYPTLFILYALRTEKTDTVYLEKLHYLNKRADVALMSFLGIKGYGNSYYSNIDLLRHFRLDWIDWNVELLKAILC